MPEDSKAHYVLLNYLFSTQHSPLAFSFLSHFSAVSWSWREAEKESMQTLRVLSFCGYEARVTSADVMRALAHVAGPTLRTLDLGGCHTIGGTDMGEIVTVCCRPLFAASHGNSPLLMAMAGGHLDLAKLLIDTGANMAITRTDSASLLSLAIVSQKEDVINFAFKYNPRRLVEQGAAGTVEAGSHVVELAQRFYALICRSMAPLTP